MKHVQVMSEYGGLGGELYYLSDAGGGPYYWVWYESTGDTESITFIDPQSPRREQVVKIPYDACHAPTLRDMVFEDMKARGFPVPGEAGVISESGYSNNTDAVTMRQIDVHAKDGSSLKQVYHLTDVDGKPYYEVKVYGFGEEDGMIFFDPRSTPRREAVKLRVPAGQMTHLELRETVFEDMKRRGFSLPDCIRVETRFE